jgi:hypothetical protein
MLLFLALRLTFPAVAGGAELESSISSVTEVIIGCKPLDLPHPDLSEEWVASSASFVQAY